MRYERSLSNQVGPRSHLSRRARLLIAVVTAIAVVVAIVIVNSGSSQYAKVTGTPAQIRATERTMLAANIVIENLGAPTPSSQSTAMWLLTSHPIAKDHNGVVAPTYPWIDPVGKLNVISRGRANRERLAQGRVIGSIFGGGARADALAEMNQVIDGEVGDHPRISAPGGAAIVKWLKVHIDGTSAQLEADVNVWVSMLTLHQRAGRSGMTQGLNANQVDAFATLKYSNGHWIVVTFNQAPWQQAT